MLSTFYVGFSFKPFSAYRSTPNHHVKVIERLVLSWVDHSQLILRFFKVQGVWINVVTSAQLMVGDKENSAGNLENF